MNPEKLTKVRIEVTERLVKTGTPNDSMNCPFARALKKVVAKNVEVIADYEGISLEIVTVEDGMNVHYDQTIQTPATVSKFMEKMDARDIDEFDDETDEPAELPPLPKPFAINLKIKNKFLRPGLRT
jgi:hypothetical protein